MDAGFHVSYRLSAQPVDGRSVGCRGNGLSEGVDVGAGDALQSGDCVGTDPLVGLRVGFAQVQVAGVEQRRAVAGVAAVGHGHHFRAAGHDQIGHAGLELNGRAWGILLGGGGEDAVLDLLADLEKLVALMGCTFTPRLPREV